MVHDTGKKGRTVGCVAAAGRIVAGLPAAEAGGGGVGELSDLSLILLAEPVELGRRGMWAAAAESFSWLITCASITLLLSKVWRQMLQR